ncbi:MAG: histidine kinase [Anaerolineaceae bacterium]|nr:histidine kinase [Anaerolineaceae bacterium]
MSNGVKYLHPAILIVLIVLFNAGFLHAQYYFNLLRPDADTLYEQLQHANERDKIDIYNSLAFYHSFSNADSAIYYAEQALELEKKHPDEIRRADANRHLGNAYSLKNHYGQALFHLNQAMNIYEDNRVLRKKAELLFDLGKLNYDLQDYPAALNYLQRFEKLYEQENNSEDIIATPLEYAIFIGLGGGIPRESGDYELAKQYFKRYIELSKLHEFPHRINAIMTISLAQTFEYNGEYDSALHYFYLALPLYHEKNDVTHQEYTGYEGAIGYILFRTGNTLEALTFIKQALQMDTALQDHYLSSIDASRLGNVYLQLGIYDSAYYYFQQVLYYTVLMHEKDMGVSLDTVKPRVYDGYQHIISLPDLQIRQKYYERKAVAFNNLYRYYLQRNDAAKALEYLQYKLPYLDSVRITTKETDLYRIQARFENERLEQQVVNLVKDNELKESRLQRNQLILVSVGLITFLVLALGALYVRQGRINALHEKLLVEQRLFRSQMSPHFIFNSLASVQNFIVKQDDTRASIYLSRFSELVRSILNNSLQEQITLEEEISTIENYLALQKVRFSDKFDYDIEADDALDPESTFIPPMLTQPFIENSIEHGIRNLEGKGKVTVRFISRNDHLLLEIEDNGIGRERAQELLRQRDKGHKSLATAITRERIAILNRKLKHKITLDIIDLKDEQGEASGTRVVFVIPV